MSDPERTSPRRRPRPGTPRRRAFDGAHRAPSQTTEGAGPQANPLAPHIEGGVLRGPYETSYDVRHGYAAERDIVKP